MGCNRKVHRIAIEGLRHIPQRGGVADELNQQRIEATDDGIEVGFLETDIVEQGIRQIHSQKGERIVIFAGA